MLAMLLGVGLLGAPLGADAQQPGKVHRIGILGATSASAYTVYVDAFRQGPVFISHAGQIADLAARRHLRTIGFAEYAEAGGLLAFGVNFADLWRRAAGFADKILKGAKPADLPVERPTKFELIVNLKTAKALGLTFRQEVILRADKLIR